MRTLFLLISSLTAATAATSQLPLSADEIMMRVAANQDVAQHARETFVYRQKVAIRLRDSHHKLMREEISAYQVIPSAQGTHKELSSFSGRFVKGRAMVSCDKSGEGRDDGFRSEADANLSKNLRQHLVDDKKSKDGVAHDLFPLTTMEQQKYRFTLKGKDNYQGTAVYRISFEPKANVGDDRFWKGEALVSQADFAPMVVTTKMAHGIPLMVRTMLGTNLPGLGFTVEYRKFDDGVWFPVSYGTEFQIKALFVYSRHVAISMVNSDFRHTDVKSSVQFDDVQ